MFHDNKVNVVVNTDQNFMYFYPEEQVIVAPKVTKSVNSKVKSDKKTEFTSMVTCNMDYRNTTPPLVVYNLEA